MARIVVQTDDGKEVGEVPYFLLSRGSAKSRYGFDGIALTSAVDEANRLDNIREMQGEAKDFVHLSGHEQRAEAARIAIESRRLKP